MMDNGYYTNINDPPQRRGVKLPNKRLYQSVDEAIREFKEQKMRESSLNQSSVREYSPDAFSGLGNNNFGSAYSDNKINRNPKQQQSEYSNGSFDEAKQQRIEKKELDKLKKQFARELKSIIESEIKKQKDEQEKLFKLQKYQSKV